MLKPDWFILVMCLNRLVIHPNNITIYNITHIINVILIIYIMLY